MQHVAGMERAAACRAPAAAPRERCAGEPCSSGRTTRRVFLARMRTFWLATAAAHAHGAARRAAARAPHAPHAASR
jgi:hypothetical protein